MPVGGCPFSFPLCELCLGFSSLFYLLYLTGWRRSHRPSLHDISIIDEEEEREDIEGIADEDTAANTLSNAQTASAFTITK